MQSFGGRGQGRKAVSSQNVEATLAVARRRRRVASDEGAGRARDFGGGAGSRSLALRWTLNSVASAGGGVISLDDSKSPTWPRKPLNEFGVRNRKRGENAVALRSGQCASAQLVVVAGEFIHRLLAVTLGPATNKGLPCRIFFAIACGLSHRLEPQTGSGCLASAPASALQRSLL